jgi:hypothetical protein
MAITIFPLDIAGHFPRIFADADADSTSENNVNDGAATIYAVTIDNTVNAAVEYLKLYNNAAPTVGTTDPDMILFITANAVRTFVFKTGNNFATALSYAMVTAGGTGGTTGPTSDVLVKILVS